MQKFKKIYLRVIGWPFTLPICAVVSVLAVLYSGFTAYDITHGLTPGARHYIQAEPIRPDGFDLEIPTEPGEQENTPQTEEFSVFETDAILQLPEQAPSEVPDTQAPILPQSTQRPQQSEPVTKPAQSTTKPPASTTRPPQTSQTQKPAQTTKPPASAPVTGWSVTYAQAKGMVKADSAYDYEDLYWLSRIISAEAKGESFTGQIGVGSVVLNRVKSKEFPGTVKGVVFDTKYGTQFTPVANGSIYQAPTQSAVVAAKMCLDGYTLSNSVLYFVNPGIASSSWIQNHRKYAFRVGNHEFYH